MQIKFLATGQSPDFYEFDSENEVITAHHNGVSETYDLSVLPEDAVFQSADKVDGVPAIRHATRINGELQVTLCQQVGPGHWSESNWMDDSEYNPHDIHVQYDVNKSHAGKPWAKTKSGKEFV